MREEWKCIYSKAGKLVYEGYMAEGAPCGSGTSYYRNGNKCQEGVFDSKGLVYGREYYPNGNIRFEGAYECNKNFGPNYPKYGACYDESGKMYFFGEVIVSNDDAYYPTVVSPEEFGNIVLIGRPDISRCIRGDEEREPDFELYVEVKDPAERRRLIAILEKNGFTPCLNGESTRESTLKSIYPVTINMERKEYGHLKNGPGTVTAIYSKRAVKLDEFLKIYELCCMLVIV